QELLRHFDRGHVRNGSKRSDRWLSAPVVPAGESRLRRAIRPGSQAATERAGVGRSLRSPHRSAKGPKCGEGGRAGPSQGATTEAVGAFGGARTGAPLGPSRSDDYT